MRLKVWVFVLLVLFCVLGCETKHNEDDALLGLLVAAQSAGGGTPIFFNYSLQNKALGTDRPLPERLGKPGINQGQPNLFTVSPSLPAGLSLNSETGLISGTPLNTSVVTMTFAITAKNTKAPSIPSKTETISIKAIYDDSSGLVCVGGSGVIAPGCNNSAPYSCGSSNFCYTSFFSCVTSANCTY
ncbi:Ig domain-containing protein [Leptospira sanjuanensis]|uniref:Ig domain-containing protein n=1 Tax=Leptospira sanjuanensis TaxID=2879643 RepID=UPI001EE8064C|nr:Ig domain-containing protein [Leptospira sanjuanensis]MCG6166848.1 Ig domain-containing protein [Leptospira sanjuanensis]